MLVAYVYRWRIAFAFFWNLRNQFPSYKIFEKCQALKICFKICTFDFDEMMKLQGFEEIDLLFGNGNLYSNVLHGIQ